MSTAEVPAGPATPATPATTAVKEGRLRRWAGGIKNYAKDTIENWKFNGEDLRNTGKAIVRWAPRVAVLGAVSGVVLAACVHTDERVARWWRVQHASLQSKTYDWLWSRYEAALFQAVEGGRVLDVGPAPGASLKSYDKDVNMDLACGPCDAGMQQLVETTAAGAGIPAGIIEIDERSGDSALAFLGKQQSASADAVVARFALTATREEPAEIANEIMRVLRPGGRFVFVERPAGDTALAWVRKALSPYTLRFLGYRLDVDVTGTLQSAGFTTVSGGWWTLNSKPEDVVPDLSESLSTITEDEMLIFDDLFEAVAWEEDKKHQELTEQAVGVSLRGSPGFLPPLPILGGVAFKPVEARVPLSVTLFGKKIM